MTFETTARAKVASICCMPVCFFESISFAATMLCMTNIRFPYIRSSKQFHLHIFIYQPRVSTEKLQELLAIARAACFTRLFRVLTLKHDLKH